MLNYDVVIVGAGISGATIAERYANDGKRVLVIDKRDHIAGNVYDEIDEVTGIRVSKYGAHLFHTNDRGVWEYVQRFGEWQRWPHHVIADISDIYVPVPVNINTVNLLYGVDISEEGEMKAWLEGEQIPCEKPINSEEVALSRVGRRLYEAIFKDYTKKQWDKEPKELQPSVLERIPVRTNFDDRYFSDKYQAMPVNGYTSIVEKMLSSSRITVKLNTDWDDIKKDISGEILVFTGPIDVYFKESGLPPLEYRSINFEWSRIRLEGYYQPNSVVNYSSANNPYTRCVEYKHFLHQRSPWTILSKETTTDSGEPYYPVPTLRNRELYNKYLELTLKDKSIHFIGRLATDKYFNMDQAIRSALDYYEEHLKSHCR
jgi:UDP-galactopyranose mutase